MAEARAPAGAVPDAGRALLQSPVRRRIVDELTGAGPQERQEGLSAAQLGERLDLHATTIRFHVDQLVAAGLLDSHFVRGGGVGRPSKKYVLHEAPLGERTRDVEGPFALLAGLLTSVLSAQEAGDLTPEEAGARWAAERAAALGDLGAGQGPAGTREAQLDKVRDVAHLLQDWGYAPDVEDEDTGGIGVTLHDCPFLSLASSHPAVVCGVHRGLLRGALDAVGEPAAKVSLRPFTGPRTCRALLQFTAPGTARPASMDTTSEPPIEGDHR